jgi:hypothetical protein
MRPKLTPETVAAASLLTLLTVGSEGCLGGGCVVPVPVPVAVPVEVEPPPRTPAPIDTNPAELWDAADEAALREHFADSAPEFFRQEFGLNCAQVLWAASRGGHPMMPIDEPGRKFALSNIECTFIVDDGARACEWTMGEFLDGRHINGFSALAICLSPDAPEGLEHHFREHAQLTTDLDLGRVFQYPLVCETIEECNYEHVGRWQTP